MRPFFAFRAKKALQTGVRRGCHYLFSLSVVCLFVSVCVTYVVFTDCESSTRPISTNPGSMEASKYGLTRGTCFVARRLEGVAVAGLLWISWCVLGAAEFFVVLFFRFFFFFERTRPAASMSPPCLIYFSTSNIPMGYHYREKNVPQGCWGKSGRKKSARTILEIMLY